MNDPRIGMAGMGQRGRAIAKAVRQSGCGFIVSYADPHGPSTDKARPLVPDATPYTDWREMLVKEHLNVVVIVAPQYLHCEISEAALQAGLDVYCEKPLAPNLEECDRIVEAARQAKSLFYVGLQRRAMALYRYIHDRVAAGAVGRPRLVSYRELRGPFKPKVENWMADDTKSGGALVEKNCHHFDLFNWYTGSRAVRVQASGGKAIPEGGGCNPGTLLDHAWVLVDYENGARACLQICFFCDTHAREVEVIGEKGRLVTRGEDVLQFSSGAKDECKVRSFSGADLHGDEAGWLDFLDHRTEEGRKTSVARAESARESVRIALAAQQAIRVGQAVLL